MKQEKSLSSPTARQTPARSSLKTVLEKVSESCTDCGICRDECGFLEKYGTPKGIADRYDPGTKEGQVMPFECSLCRLCDAVCPFEVKPSEMFLEMRREAVDRGAGSFPEHGGLLAYEGKGMSKRFTWYGLTVGCRTVLFPGCAMPGTRPARTKELFETLRKQDPTMGIVFDCCGKISHDLGREAFFKAMFDEMKNYLLSQGVQEILVVCSNCHDMFSRYGEGLNVRMVYEALPESGSPSAKELREFMLHDPCGVRFHTAAHSDVRRLLDKIGIHARDMDHTREKTLCCGSGAGVNVLSPPLADRWTEQARKEAGNCSIATYCCGCAERLSKAEAVHALISLRTDTHCGNLRLKRPSRIEQFVSKAPLERTNLHITESLRPGEEKDGPVWRFLPPGNAIVAFGDDHAVSTGKPSVNSLQLWSGAFFYCSLSVARHAHAWSSITTPGDTLRPSGVGLHHHQSTIGLYCFLISRCGQRVDRGEASKPPVATPR